MRSKFKAGDRVFDMGGHGAGTVSFVFSIDAFGLPVSVGFDSGKTASFTFEGHNGLGGELPCLVTLEEARARGFGVPKKKVTKEIKVWKIYNTRLKDFEPQTLEHTANLGVVTVEPYRMPVLLTGKIEVEE